MSKLCWCGSGINLEECHLKLDTQWKLPIQDEYILKFSKEITADGKNNILAFIIDSIPEITIKELNGSFILSSKEVYWDFMYQTVWAYPNMSTYNDVRIPQYYNEWLESPKEPKDGFIVNQFSNLREITNLSDVNDLFNYQDSISKIFLFSDNSNLIENSKRIIKKFMKDFEKGYIDFISIHKNSQVLPNLYRLLSREKILGFTMSKKLFNSNWKEPTPDNIVFSLSNILFNLFGKGTYGFSAEWLSRSLLFTYGKSIDFPYLEYASLSIRGAKNKFDFQNSGSTITFGISPLDFRVFTGWYLHQCNKFLTYFLHPLTFANPSKEVDTVKHYKNILTIEQIVQLILLILSTKNIYLKNTLTVQLLGILSKNIDDLFTEKFKKIMLGNLDQLPTSIRIKYIEHSKVALNIIDEEVWSKLIPDFKKGNEVHLPNGKKMTRPGYLGYYIRSIRNTVHGYADTYEDTFNNVLFTNSGKCPENLHLLVPIIFLNIIIKPDLFFPSMVFKYCFENRSERQ